MNLILKGAHRFRADLLYVLSANKEVFDKIMSEAKNSNILSQKRSLVLEFFGKNSIASLG